MIGPRWRKVLADMLGNRARTLLVAVSIAVGVFAVGMIAGSFVIIGHDLPVEYLAANPHAAVIAADSFGDDLVQAAARVPGVSAAEGRSALTARIEVHPGEWRPVQITGIPLHGATKIDRLRPAQPGAPVPAPGDHQVLIERSGLGILPVTTGSVVHVMWPDRKVRALRVAGIVYDPTSAPASFTGTVALFVNPATMEWLTGSRDYSRMLITVDPTKTSQAQVKAVAQAVSDKIQRSGRRVVLTTIEQPGQHPLNNIIQTFLAVLGILGLLALALSGFLVVNTVNALLGQQVRQIGVMKAVGAATPQIVGMYAVTVLGFGILAMALAAPLAALAGFGLAGFVARFLNFSLLGFRVPVMPLELELAVALLLPLLASIVPVLGGTRITVREAINSYGIGGGGFGRGLLDRLLSSMRFLSRPVLLSLRNIFRRKGRLVLTLSTLTLAGAIFIAVLNLQASFDLVIRQVLGYFLSDVNIVTTRPYPTAEIESTLAGIGAVRSVEAWAQVGSQILSRDGATSDEIIIVAPPAGSRLIRPVITQGRWLLPQDKNAIMVDNHLLKIRPDLRVGDDVVLKLNGKKYTWRIVGFYQMAGNVDPPLVYANREYLGQVLDSAGQASVYRVVTASGDAATEARVAQAIQDRFRLDGVHVGDVTTGAAQRAIQANSTNIIIYFLLVMALLIALVGGLGLMGTMSINVLERTREIGVMRAIGAANRSILALVVMEGMLIGVASWLLGAALSFPITQLMDNLVGRAFVQIPVDFALSQTGFVVWLALMLVLSLLASLLPALNAERISVRDALAYE